MNIKLKWHSKTKNNTLDKFQIRSDEETQAEEMELYLNKLNKVEVPKVKKSLSVKVKVALCSGTILALGLVFIFLLDGGNKLKSAFSSPSTKDTYLALEKSYSNSMEELFTTSSSIINKIKENNTQFSGNMKLQFYSDFSDIFAPLYQYDINGYLTKECSSATLALSLNDEHIVTNDFYKKAGEDSFYFDFPEYDSKLIDLNLQTDQQYSKLLNYLMAIAPSIRTYYSQLIDTLADKGTITYHDDVGYKVGNLSTTCSSYDVSVTSKQYNDIIKKLIGDILEDNTLGDKISNLKPFFLAYLSNMTSDSMTMTVFCDDTKILGRSIQLDINGRTFILYIGSLEVKNEYSFDCYLQEYTEDQSDGYIANLNVSASNFRNTYSGSISLSMNNIKLEGTFSKVTFNPDALFPLSGKLKANYITADEIPGLPNALDLDISTIQDKLQVYANLYHDKEFHNSTTNDEVAIGYSCYCSTSLNLTAEPSVNIAFTPKETSKDMVCTSWKDVSDSLSNQPIENIFNSYVKAFNGKTKYSREKALKMIEDGYIYPFFPDMAAMSGYYNYGTSYYNASDYGIEEGTQINILGEYITYPTTSYSSAADYINEYLPDATPLYQDEVFTTTVDQTIESILTLCKKDANLDFHVITDNTIDSITIYNNIFTGEKNYSAVSSLQLYKNVNTPIAGEMAIYTISILYDAITKKIQYVSFNFPYSLLTDDQFIDFSCKLAHIIEPSITTEEYSSHFYRNGLLGGYAIGSFLSGEQKATITLESSEYVLETGDTQKYQACTISSDASIAINY